MKFEVQLVPLAQVCLHIFFLLLNSHFSGSSHPEVLLGEGVLEVSSEFAGEHLCQDVISMKLQSNFVEIALWHGCSLYFQSTFS